MTAKPDKPAKKSADTASSVGKDVPPKSAEVVIFPGVDFRKVAEALGFWKRTGKPFKQD